VPILNAMGIFDFLTGGAKPPPGAVRGSAQVVSSTRHTGRGIYQNCRLNLVIQAPGVAPFAAEFHGLVHHKHWPTPGALLPVALDPRDPRRFTILWDELPDNRDHARQTAESIAAAMRGEPPVTQHPAPGQFPGQFPFSGAQVQFVGDPSQLTEEQKAKLRALGIDPDQIPGAQQRPLHPQAPPPQPQPDTLSQLERLAALRAQGVLTDEEFEAQKRRILGN
jgi:hypothetical protein